MFLCFFIVVCIGLCIADASAQGFTSGWVETFDPYETATREPTWLDGPGGDPDPDLLYLELLFPPYEGIPFTASAQPFTNVLGLGVYKTASTSDSGATIGQLPFVLGVGGAYGNASTSNYGAAIGGLIPYGIASYGGGPYGGLMQPWLTGADRVITPEPPNQYPVTLSVSGSGMFGMYGLYGMGSPNLALVTPEPPKPPPWSNFPISMNQGYGYPYGGMMGSNMQLPSWLSPGAAGLEWNGPETVWSQTGFIVPEPP